MSPFVWNFRTGKMNQERKVTIHSRYVWVITKLHNKSFWNDGNAFYLVWSGDYADIYICHNLLNCIFKMGTFCKLYSNKIDLKSKTNTLLVVPVMSLAGRVQCKTAGSLI